MSLTVLTPATSRRLTTAEALYQDTGNVVYLEEPTLVNAMIDQASAAIESYCGRIFAQQRYEEIGPEVCGPQIILRQRPIVEVDALTTHDATPIENYRIEQAEAGLLFRRGGWGWGYYGHYDSWYGWYELTCVYTSGYILPEQTTPPAPLGPVLPPDIERACLETVKVWFSERQPDARITSRRLGDQSISYSIQAGTTALPMLAQHALEPYKAWVIR